MLVQLHLGGAEARADLKALRGTPTLVEDGLVAVPPIRLGTSDAEALTMLAEVGLEGVVPEVGWPHYVTESDPPAGSVVPEGSVVALRIGDG